ncbi:MAG: lanthionine synthetase LanC family protein, partial [Acidobacteriota bacterium]
MTRPQTSPLGPSTDAPSPGLPGLAGADFRALDAALEICSLRVRCGPGAYTWLAEPLEDGRPPRPLGPHLYDGTAGISLFLAAAYCQLHATPADAASLVLIRETAVGGLAPLRAKLAKLAQVEASKRPRLGAGGLQGAGCFVYAFTRTGTLLEDPSLHRDALAVARAFLTPTQIAEDVHLDVLSGAAGALLGLLALHDALSSDPASAGAAADMLDVARCAGRHLMARQQVDGGWPLAELPALTGFAHGASGIGHALLSLAGRVDGSERDRLRDSALRGFAFERSLFVPRARTWMDPRRRRPLEQSAWCHGAPGVLLSRLAAVRSLDDPWLHRDLEQALELTCELDEKEQDHLCCGNAGLVEMLLLAGHGLDDGRCRALAAARIGSVEQRDLRFPTDEPDSTHLSLFLGRAGWGWVLLQAAAGGSLPSVLLMEQALEL